MYCLTYSVVDSVHYIIVMIQYTIDDIIAITYYKPMQVYYMFCLRQWQHNSCFNTRLTPVVIVPVSTNYVQHVRVCVCV